MPPGPSARVPPPTPRTFAPRYPGDAAAHSASMCRGYAGPPAPVPPDPRAGGAGLRPGSERQRSRHLSCPARRQGQDMTRPDRDAGYRRGASLPASQRATRLTAVGVAIALTAGLATAAVADEAPGHPPSPVRRAETEGRQPTLEELVLQALWD